MGTGYAYWIGYCFCYIFVSISGVSSFLGFYFTQVVFAMEGFFV
jgi:hypothetical protein